MNLLLAALGFVLKLLGWSRSPKASPEAVASANAAQEHVAAEVDVTAAKAQERMAQAVVDAPTTQDQVVTELRKGTF